MTDVAVGRVRDRLRAVHDGLWDEAVGLVRLPPGAAPGVDLSSFHLHAVRETALGALADLADGRDGRAIRALWSVLALQHDAPGRAWDATFPVTAEAEPPPGDGAVEWVHYDPNWRQFVGCALALASLYGGDRLPVDLRAAVDGALGRCVDGEPEDRIADAYTNPALMHAWLAAWVGVRCDRPDLLAVGRRRAEALVARVERYGDVDEYNSPTYDGVDLFALALWVIYPPEPWFAEQGTLLLAVVAGRVGALFHPATGALCGPYIRTYGLGLDRYVSLVAEWLVLAGVDPADVLPPVLDEHTTHVHDLYFFAPFELLAAAVVPRLVLAEGPRVHEQRFGAVRAVSRISARTAIGAEHGRRPTFAAGQHVPFTVHHRSAAGVDWLGAKPGTGAGAAGLDAEALADDHARFAVAAEGAGPVEVELVCSADPLVDGSLVSVGAIDVRFTAPPATATAIPGPDGVTLALSWPGGSQIGAEVHVT